MKWRKILLHQVTLVLDMVALKVWYLNSHRKICWKSGVPTDDRPRHVIIKIHRSWDVAMITSAARHKGSLHYEGQPIRISTDISVVRFTWRAFNPITAELIKKDVHFQMNFRPCYLSRWAASRSHSKTRKIPRLLWGEYLIWRVSPLHTLMLGGRWVSATNLHAL